MKAAMQKATKVSPSMTKKEIMDEYNRLLEVFIKEAAAREESDRRLTELEKQKNSEALDSGLDTTADSVLEGIGRLRTLFGVTLNELGDKMVEQAEKLEKLNRSVSLQEMRLGELYNIECAADTIAKLASTYAEEMNRLESKYSTLTHGLEQNYAEKAAELEVKMKARREELEQQIAEQRDSWKNEAKETKKERLRETSDYKYETDRKRRLDENEYTEKKIALDKELHSLKEKSQKVIAEREAAVAAKEAEFKQMAGEVESFSKQLETAVAEAREESAAAVRIELEHKAALTAVEQQWKRKAMEQESGHYRALVKSLETKIEALTAELVESRKQVNMIAEKAIGGTSIAKAFESVNRIALEQARPHDKQAKQ